MGNVSPCKVWSLGAPWAKLCWWQLSAHLKTTLPGCLIDHQEPFLPHPVPLGGWHVIHHHGRWNWTRAGMRHRECEMWQLLAVSQMHCWLWRLCVSLRHWLGYWDFCCEHELFHTKGLCLKTESLFPWWVLLEHRSLECLHKSHSLQQEMSLSQVSVCRHRHLSISQGDPGSLGGLSKYLEFGIKVRKWDFLAL